MGDLTIDYAERRVTLAGRPVPLTDLEYRLLFELSVNAGRLLDHEHLLQRVWGMGLRLADVDDDAGVTERAVTVLEWQPSEVAEASAGGRRPRSPATPHGASEAPVSRPA